MRQQSCPISAAVSNQRGQLVKLCNVAPCPLASPTGIRVNKLHCPGCELQLSIVDVGSSLEALWTTSLALALQCLAPRLDLHAGSA